MRIRALLSNTGVRASLLSLVALFGCSSPPTQQHPGVGELVRTIRAADQQYHAGKLDEAERLYQEVLEIDPRYIDAHVRLGVIAHQRSDYATAETRFKEVLARDPRHLAAMYNLSAVHMEQAHSYLETYLQISPSQADRRTEARELIRAMEAFAKR